MGENEGGFPKEGESLSSLSFADILNQSQSHYELTLQEKQNRNEEIFNESILNQNSGYQVVLGENGHLATEDKELYSDTTPTVSDAGAPNSDGLSDTQEAQKAKNQPDSHENQTVAEGSKESVEDKIVENVTGAGKEIAEGKNQSVKAALSGEVGEGKRALKKLAKNDKGETQTLSVESQKAVGDGVKETLLQAAKGKSKTAKQGVGEASESTPQTKATLTQEGGRERLERVITVSVVQKEEVTKEGAKESKAAALKKTTLSTSGEEKIVDKNGASENLLQSLGQTKDGFTAEKNSLQGITKADLVRELKEQGHSEILKEAKILVKDGQSGEIKMVLRPQELGTVKINLILENKHIVAKIFVDNNIVKDALQTALGDLKEVFAEQGMELGSLDVFVSQQSQDNQPLFAEEEVDITSLKLAHAVGEVEKHTRIIHEFLDYNEINIEV